MQIVVTTTREQGRQKEERALEIEVILAIASNVKVLACPSDILLQIKQLFDSC